MIYITDFKPEKEKTCLVSGHREIKEKINVGKLKEIFKELIDRGIDTFLVGMALGFDTICFKALEILRKTNKIKIIACVPCISQSSSFSLEQKREYLRMKYSADEAVLVSENYTPYCMLKRNEYMVDRSSVAVIYIRNNKGGTFNTMKLSKKRGLEIIYF